MKNFLLAALVLRGLDVFGVIGNIFSIIIWKVGKKSKFASCATFMICLGFSDLFTLFNSNILFLITGGMITDKEKTQKLLNRNEFSCKFIIFSVMVSTQISAWTTVAIAFQRMLFMAFPVKMHQSNQKTRCIIASFLIVLFSSTLNLFELIVPEIQQVKSSNETLSVCTKTKAYFMMHSVSYVFLTALIPLLALAMCNSIILIKVCVRKEDQVSHIARRQQQVKNITTVVVGVTVLHFIATSPVAIYTLCDRFLNFKMGENILIIFSTFVHLNSGLNFILYYLLGTDFRQDMKELFGNLYNCCRSKCQRKLDQEEDNTSRF